MKMTNRNLHILSSPGFLIGLSLLLTNDFMLKEQFHNGFTGKLSDFAGLFVFSLFWIAFFPRHKRLICVATAVLFVFWKSAYSQSLIEGWNSLPFFGIQRTVDYSDLCALLVLPLSYYYSGIPSGVQVSRRLIHAIAIVSVLAFTATSYSHKASFNNEYEFETSRKQLLERMSRLPKNEVNNSFWKGGDAFEVGFDDCISGANITLADRENHSVITLKQMEFRCPSKPNPDEMRLYFEKEFIDKLRQEPIVKSGEVTYVWSSSLATPSNTPSP